MLIVSDSAPGSGLDGVEPSKYPSPMAQEKQRQQKMVKKPAQKTLKEKRAEKAAKKQRPSS